MWVPGAVQLSACISVNTCTQLRIYNCAYTLSADLVHFKAVLALPCYHGYSTSMGLLYPRMWMNPAGKLSASPQSPQCLLLQHTFLPEQNSISCRPPSALSLSFFPHQMCSKVEKFARPVHTRKLHYVQFIITFIHCSNFRQCFCLQHLYKVQECLFCVSNKIYIIAFKCNKKRSKL